MDLIIVTGMSGSGKSTALNALEDIGFYCIDNFPPSLIEMVYTLAKDSETISKKIAITLDVRSHSMFKDIEHMLDFLDEKGIKYSILFIDASRDKLVQRYKETRRNHPLMSMTIKTLDQAIDLEKEKLTYLRSQSDFVIDTSNLLVKEFKEELIAKVGMGMNTELTVTFVSFGFKYGILTDADVVFDLRCLRNPYYIPELRELTGEDQAVRDYVMDSEDSIGLYQRIYEYLDFSVPLYKREGKSQLVIGIGCTGGKHRSVTFTKLLADAFQAEGIVKTEQHRDILK